MLIMLPLAGISSFVVFRSDGQMYDLTRVCSTRMLLVRRGHLRLVVAGL